MSPLLVLGFFLVNVFTFIVNCIETHISTECRPRSDVTLSAVYSGSALFAYVLKMGFQSKRGLKIPFCVVLFSAALIEWQSPFLSTVLFCLPTSSTVYCKTLIFGGHFILRILAEKKKIAKSKCHQFKLKIIKENNHH